MAPLARLSAAERLVYVRWTTHMGHRDISRRIPENSEDEPRIVFLRDTDGDQEADEVTHFVDEIATNDRHHAMGAFAFSHGRLSHMLEGVSMSTTLESP